MIKTCIGLPQEIKAFFYKAPNKNRVWTSKYSALFYTIIVIGLVLRLGYTYYSPDLKFTDEHRFLCYAQSIIDSGDFVCNGVHTHDMPLTAFVFALLQNFFGPSIILIKISLAIVSTLIIPIVGGIAYRLTQSQNAFLMAMLMTAIYPFFIYYSNLLLSETFFLLWVSALLYVVLRPRSAYSWMALGIFAALSHLTRPTLLLWQPVMWGYLWWAAGWKVKDVGMSALVFVLGITPWVIRNQQVHGHLVLGTLGAGHTLLEGNNPGNQDGGVYTPLHAPYFQIPEGLSEYDKNQAKTQKAKQYIQQDWKAFFERLPKKFLRFWHLWPNAEAYSKGLYKWLSLLSFGPILLFALLSPFLLQKNMTTMFFLWGFIGYYTALHLVFLGSIRYRLPIEPLLIALAAAAFDQFFNKINASRHLNQ